MKDHARGCEGRNYTCTCGHDAASTALVEALTAAEPYVELCHSLMTQKDTRAQVWRVLKQVRAALSASQSTGGEEKDRG